MPKRTKQQIKEDKAKLLEKKKKALKKLNEHIDDVVALSDEDIQKVNEFIGLFLKCETVYKTLYPEMKKIKDDETIDVRQLKFNVQWFEAALRFFGITYNHDDMNKMFGAKKSYLTCRDNILHGLKLELINEVVANFDEMKSTMDTFLQNVKNGQPK